MKEAVIIFLLAILATCWVLDDGAPPKTIGVRSNVGMDAKAGTKIEDRIIGNFSVIEKLDKEPYRSSVADDNDPGAGEAHNVLPLSGHATAI